VCIDQATRKLFTPEERAAEGGNAAPRRSAAAAPAGTFWERASARCHLVVCLDPAAPAFRARCRMFPGAANPIPACAA